MKKSLSLSPDALKLCACALMTFDHTAAVFFPQNLLLRIPGRPAFVIFAFLLAQGVAGELCDWKNSIPSCYCYMALNLLGNVCCIPVWHLLGIA